VPSGTGHEKRDDQMLMHNVMTRPYSPARDEGAVFELWQNTIGERWPLSSESFHRVTVGNRLYQPGDHLVAELGGKAIGFVATQARKRAPGLERRGEIMLILVEKDEQRRGIGRALLDAALAHLRQAGVADAQLGGGGRSYFWPGVPGNLPGAVAFFESCGWEYSETSVDMYRDLTDYTTPAYVLERVQKANIRISVATARDVPQILAFEKWNFPNWYDGFRANIETANHADILFAQDPRNDVVGTVTVFSPASSGHAFIWKRDRSTRHRPLFGSSIQVVRLRCGAFAARRAYRNP